MEWLMCDRQSPISRRRTLKGLLLASSTALLPRVSAADAPRRRFMDEAGRLKQVAIARGDPGYGAVVVRGDEVVGRGASAVVSSGDPTAHAEMLAIRDACRTLATRDLSDCTLYGTTRACPMCETAAYWARVSALVSGEDLVADGAPGYPKC